MKSKLLLFLFIFLLIVGVVSANATQRTLQIKFAFDPTDNPTKNLLGYRLYKDNEQVTNCEVTALDEMTCVLYEDDGTFHFTLAAYYSDNTESPRSPSYSVQFTSPSEPPPDPLPSPPTAEITSSAATGRAPLKVDFDSTSSTTPNPPIVSRRWDFGDGSSVKTGATASHTYGFAGTYLTKLTVEDSEGRTDSATIFINVIESDAPNEKPVAVISADAIQCEPSLSVLYDGSQSSDPDGSIIHYDWNFGDGTSDTGPTVEHTYSELAVYTVSLQVTDDQGETATVSREMTCNTAHPDLNHPPIFLQTIYNLLLLD